MKKLVFSIAVVAGLLATAACQKEYSVSDVDNIFEISADVNPVSKTVLDGYEVSWVDGDKISVVINDSTATEWKSSQEFIYDSGSGKFTCAFSPKAGTYNFKALYGDNAQYSYHKNTGTTYKLSDTQNQDCDSPVDHLPSLDALAGTFETTVPLTSSVQLHMSHIFTLMEFNLINSTGSAITATSLNLKCDNEIAGVFTVDYSTTPPSVNGVKQSKKAVTVNLTNGEIDNDASLSVYLVMAPLDDYSGDITVSVVDSEGNTYKKTATLANATFAAGKLNKTNFTLSTPTPLEYKTISEARAASAEFAGDLNVKNLQVVATGSSNYLVQDATGAMLVYLNPGSLAVGDSITFLGGTSTTYQNIRQLTAGSANKTGNSTPSYPVPTELDGAGLDAIGTSLASGSRVGEYCSFTGVLTISSGKYYNVSVAGATKIAAIVAPNSDLSPAVVSGKTLEVTGYSLYLSNQYVYFIATDIKEACAAPVFSPQAGAVVSGTEVSLSSSTEGATIYYTTDGTTPTTSSSVYSSPITVTTEITIKAFAAKTGMKSSTISTAKYTISSATSIICDFTTKKYGHSYYTDDWCYGDEKGTDPVWKVKYGANNNKGWAFVKMGGKSATITTSNPCEIWYTGKVTTEAKKVSVSIASGSLSKSGMSVKSWGVYVYSDADMKTLVDSVSGGIITNSANVFDFEPNTGKKWENCYFKVSFDLANTTTTNGIVCVDKVTISF